MRLGLGLYIATEIAKAHHGEIRAQSDETQTIFSVRLPRRNDDQDFTGPLESAGCRNDDPPRSAATNTRARRERQMLSLRAFRGNR